MYRYIYFGECKCCNINLDIKSIIFGLVDKLNQSFNHTEKKAAGNVGRGEKLISTVSSNHSNTEITQVMPK